MALAPSQSATELLNETTQNLINQMNMTVIQNHVTSIKVMSIAHVTIGVTVYLLADNNTTWKESIKGPLFLASYTENAESSETPTKYLLAVLSRDGLEDLFIPIAGRQDFEFHPSCIIIRVYLTSQLPSFPLSVPSLSLLDPAVTECCVGIWVVEESEDGSEDMAKLTEALEASLNRLAASERPSLFDSPAQGKSISISELFKRA